MLKLFSLLNHYVGVELTHVVCMNPSLIDAAHVIESLKSSDPIPVLGHSKGGGMMNQLAELFDEDQKDILRRSA